ncbi:MAG: dienelactone hydrolase family protein [Myxococcaceae bacterium]|nr:dienelactone hydrolase family protein [Myxococcaceae bacterium]
MARALLLTLVLPLAGCRTPTPPAGTPLVSIRSEAPAGRAPVLVLLHGLGANEHDLFELGRQVAPPGTLVVAVRAPIQLGPASYGWFSLRFPDGQPWHDAGQAEAARRRIVEFVRALAKEPGVDAGRITLLGFSQGAILSEAVALTEPALVSAVVLCAGRTLPELKAVASSKRPRVLLLHGRQDPVLRYENAVTTNEVLREAGYAVDFRSFDAGHTIDAAMAEAIRGWLRGG